LFEEKNINQQNTKSSNGIDYEKFKIVLKIQKVPTQICCVLKN